MKTVIYGNGAMARVLHSYARHTMDIAAFTVDDTCIAEGADEFCGRPLVPFSRIGSSFAPSRHDMLIAVGYADMNTLRARKTMEARQKGFAITGYIHPSFILHDEVEIGAHCIILDVVSIHPGVRIGAGTFMTGRISIGHDCRVGPNCWISSGVSLAGGCSIGDSCFFGVNASVADGIRIGDRNFIAANTLVNRDTSDDQVHISEPGQLFPLRSSDFLPFSRRLRASLPPDSEA